MVGVRWARSLNPLLGFSSEGCGPPGNRANILFFLNTLSIGSGTWLGHASVWTAWNLSVFWNGLLGEHVAVPLMQESWRSHVDLSTHVSNSAFDYDNIPWNTFLFPSPTSLNEIPLNLLIDSRGFPTSLLLAEGNTYENLLKIIDDSLIISIK